MDLHQLEHQIINDKSLQTKENWLLLADNLYAQYKNADPRTKYKMGEKVGFHYYQAYLKGDNSKEELENYIKILQTLKYEPRRLSKIIGDYMTITGGEPKTITTKQGVCDVESGTLAVYDSGFLYDFHQQPTTPYLLSQMNQGQVFYWGTGGDGGFDITLRCTDGAEPVATAKEYRFLVASTPQAIIAVPSGNIVVSDTLADGQKVTIPVTPGNYNVQVHFKNIPDRYFGYVVVVCSTIEAATNSFTDYPTLG